MRTFCSHSTHFQHTSLTLFPKTMAEFIVTSQFEESKYLHGLESLTLPEYILKNTEKAARDGKGSLIIDALTGKSHEFADFETKTRKIGSFLWKRGMRKGNTAVYLTNDVLNIHLFFCGVWRANGIVRASYAEDDQETLLDRVKDSRATWILCDPVDSSACLSVASKVSWKVEVVVVGEAEGCTPLRHLFEDDGTALPCSEITPEDTALILCTSGTTGKSKGAAYSHAGLVYHLDTVKYLPFTPNKPNLILSKGTHVTGSTFPISCFVSGSTALVMSKITIEDVFKAVDKYKPGFIFGFPPFLLNLVNDPDATKYDTSSIEVATIGRARVSPAIVSTIMQLPNLKAVINSYGATETPSVVNDLDLGNSEVANIRGTPAYSIGRVFIGTTLKIRDVETGESLGPNQRGEICVKSKGLFHSYYNNPEATENSFENGFYRTGDIGYYDENGFVFLVDRIKEMFHYDGNHVSPTELEEVIQKHPDVLEVCVVGVPDPSGWEHIPRAFVTVRKYSDSNIKNSEAEKEIQEFANGKLANYKHLRGGVFIVRELPKGKTGKITRRLIAEYVPIRSS